MQAYLSMLYLATEKIINTDSERVSTGSLKFSDMSLSLYTIFEESRWQSDFSHLAVGGLIAFVLGFYAM